MLRNLLKIILFGSGFSLVFLWILYSSRINPYTMLLSTCVLTYAVGKLISLGYDWLDDDICGS